MLVQVELSQIMVHQKNSIFILRDTKNNERYLPLNVKFIEASSVISMVESQSQKKGKDVLMKIFSDVEVIFEKLVITSYQHGHFDAYLYVYRHQVKTAYAVSIIEGIEISIRTNVLVFVEDKVFDDFGGDIENQQIYDEIGTFMKDFEEKILEEADEEDSDLLQEQLGQSPSMNQAAFIHFLQKKLEKYVIEERYEEAAKLRDQIREMKQMIDS